MARGLTIVGMIVVNNPGSWEVTYGVLQHAQWHGFGIVDLGFPAFLFLMGMAAAVTFERRRARGETDGALVRKACRRALVLFGVGLALAAFPFFTLDPALGLHPNLQTLRIPGVLQRIAVCYLAVAGLLLYTRPRTQYVLAAGLLLVYWAALAWIPVPGYGAGNLAPPEATLPAFVDRLVFGRHLLAGGWDPEGLLSTFPAVVTALIGLWTGRALMSPAPITRVLVRLGAGGAVLVALGCAWHAVLPINKQLWTSSYAVLTAGLSLVLFVVLYWAVDVVGHAWMRRWFVRPLSVFGVNALTVYVLSGLASEVLEQVRVPSARGVVSLRAFLFENVFGAFAPPVAASLLYALAWLVVWYFVLRRMARRGWTVTV